MYQSYLPLSPSRCIYQGLFSKNIILISKEYLPAHFHEAEKEMQLLDNHHQRIENNLRNKMESKLNNERNHRANLENKLINLKDRQLYREQITQDIDYRCQNLEQENLALQDENEDLRRKTIGLEQTTSAHIRTLEQEIDEGKREHRSLQQQHAHYLRRLEQEHEHQLRKLNQEWDLRFHDLEEKFFAIENVRVELEQENAGLRENIANLKIDHQERMRQMEHDIQEDEHDKYVAAVRALETKLNQAEQSRELLHRKNSQLIHELEAKERDLHDQYIGMENEINKLRMENTDLVNDLNVANVTIDKLKADLLLRENTLHKMEADIAEIQRELHNEREKHREASDHLLAEHQNERNAWERMKHNQDQRIKELEGMLHDCEHELVTVRANYERLCQMLQSNVHRAITGTINSNVTYNPHIQV